MLQTSFPSVVILYILCSFHLLIEPCMTFGIHPLLMLVNVQSNYGMFLIASHDPS